MAGLRSIDNEKQNVKELLLKKINLNANYTFDLET